MKAQKQKGRWHILKVDFDRFQSTNARKLKKIQEEYIDLWRQGLTWQQLKDRTRDDFDKRGIIYGDMDGFAEWTIYNHIMAEQQNKQ